MRAGPPVVVFDVNETLSDMTAIAGRFEEIGAPAHLAPLWFTTVLRNGFALSTTGRPATFSQIGDAVLRELLAPVALDRDLDSAVAHVLEGFMDLPVHPDVAAGVRDLWRTGHRMVTLSNGSAEIAERLLTNAGIRDVVETCLSADDAGAWKPDRRAYDLAARFCGVPLTRMVLVAVHPWDIDGAARAGMGTAWVDREGVGYPPHFTPPQHVVSGIGDLVGALGA